MLRQWGSVVGRGLPNWENLQPDGAGPQAAGWLDPRTPRVREGSRAVHSAQPRTPNAEPLMFGKGGAVDSVEPRAPERGTAVIGKWVGLLAVGDRLSEKTPRPRPNLWLGKGWS